MCVSYEYTKETTKADLIYNCPYARSGSFETARQWQASSTPTSTVGYVLMRGYYTRTSLHSFIYGYKVESCGLTCPKSGNEDVQTHVKILKNTFSEIHHQYDR